jgi:NAD(P)H-hydrate epimerase
MRTLVLSRAGARALDRAAIEDYGIPGAVLMENAGRGTADLLRKLGAKGNVYICCGPGNNGGDGLVIARHLDVAEIPIEILLFAAPESLSGDAALNYQIVSRAKLPIHVYPGGEVDKKSLDRMLQGGNWIVDALFGTGLTGSVRPPFGEIIAVINDSAARIMAVDIPSGLDCDTGQPLGPTIQAEHTATFVAMKQGFTNPKAKAWLGVVHVLDIGIPRILLESATSHH